MEPVKSIGELPKDKHEEELVSRLLSTIRSVRYGYVEIIIQDGEVVQINKTEKIRLEH